MNLLNDTLCDSIFVCVCLGEGVARGGGVGLAMVSPGSVEFVAAVVAARGDETQAATARGSPEDGPSHVPRPQGSLHVSGRFRGARTRTVLEARCRLGAWIASPRKLFRGHLCDTVLARTVYSLQPTHGLTRTKKSC